MTPYRDEWQALGVAHYVAGKVSCRGPAYVGMIGGTDNLQGWMQDAGWDQRMALATLTLQVIRERVPPESWMVLQLKWATEPAETIEAQRFVVTQLSDQFGGRYPRAFLDAVALHWAVPNRETRIQVEHWERNTGLSERTIRYWLATVREALKTMLLQAMSDAAQVLADEGLIDG